MNLDEAIKHYEEVAESEERNAKLHQRPDRSVKGSGKRYLSCLECASEHRQIAEWLKELKAVREAWNDLVETVVEIKDNAVDDKDSDSNARDMAKFFFNYLRVLEEGIMKEVW